MRTKLCLAAIGAALVIVVPTASAPAQVPSYYGVCQPGFEPNPGNPYYCIPVTDGRRPKPKLTLKVKPKRDKSAPIRYTAKGKLTSRKGVSKRRGCRGRVRVTVKQGRRTVARKTTRIKRAKCNYRTKVKIKTSKLRGAKGKLKVRARFGGNAALRPAKSRIRTVRFVK